MRQDARQAAGTLPLPLHERQACMQSQVESYTPRTVQ